MPRCLVVCDLRCEPKLACQQSFSKMSSMFYWWQDLNIIWLLWRLIKAYVFIQISNCVTQNSSLKIRNKYSAPALGVFWYMTHWVLTPEWYRIGDPCRGENMVFLRVICRTVRTETTHQVVQDFVMPSRSKYCCSAGMTCLNIVLKNAFLFTKLFVIVIVNDLLNFNA